jgi:transposase-like protein
MADLDVNSHRAPNGDFATKYNENRGQELIDAMSNGESITEASRLMGIGKKTLYDWRDKYPEFASAWVEAHDASLVWWERIARKAAQGAPCNSAVWTLVMKNRFGWRDAMDSNVTQISTNVTVSLSPEEELQFKENYAALFGAKDS